MIFVYYRLYENENIDSYVGTKVKITGYIYRLIDFSDNQFVIARDMRFNNNSNSLVIGFLCESKDAHKYSDGTWVDVLGIIKKGKFNDDLAILNVILTNEDLFIDELFNRMIRGQRRIDELTVAKIARLLSYYSADCSVV
jgi:uncharacterized membrane protein YcgQ (UPF0703/DUF1980 family)